MAVKSYTSAPKPKRPPTWLMFALPAAALVLAPLGYLAYDRYQNAMVEQYICIQAPDCPVQPQFVPRYAAK